MYFVGGFGAASWAPLVPLLKLRLGVAEDVLGMLLLCIGIGSLLTMPLSGAASTRFGCRRVLATACLFYALILYLLATIDSITLAVPILLAFGAAMGAIDVVVNIEAVLVEQMAGRRIMSGMHAFWSVGGFAGAGLFGLWTGMAGLSPLASTCIAAGLMLLLAALSFPYLLPYGGGGGGQLIAIPKGIVIFVGIVALISFLVEGAIMDWGGVYLTQERGFDLSLAGMGFTVFSSAMLLMRLAGDSVTERLGQHTVVQGGTALAIAGFLAVIFAPSAPVLYAGFFAIGIGCANIVPIFFSLLGKQDEMPVALAVSAVGTFGYLGILAGPAAIGFLAHAIGLSYAFVFLAGLLLLQGVIAEHVFRSVLK